MVKKKFMVFGVVLALLAGGTSVSAATVPDSSVAGLDSVVSTAETGLPAKIVGDEELLIPKGTNITGDLLRNHYKIVDSAGNDVGMSDKIRFVDGKGRLITPEDEAVFLNNIFAQDSTRSISIITMLEGYQTLFDENTTVKISSKAAINPTIVVKGNGVHFIEGQPATAAGIMAGFTIVNSDGTEMPELLPSVRFSNGAPVQYKTAQEEADFINQLIADHGYADWKDSGIYVGISLEGPAVPTASRIFFDEAVIAGNVSYSTHVQNVGWQDPVKDGLMSGTEGKSLRLEGIKINSGIAGVGIEYATHVENIGWQGYAADGLMSGTSSKGLRLEAIKIKLTGAEAAKYDVYYRVHAQNVGWMGWASNDAESGTAGFGYRLEGIEIQILPKGEKPSGMSDAAPFMKYVAPVQNVDSGWGSNATEADSTGSNGGSGFGGN